MNKKITEFNFILYLFISIFPSIVFYFLNLENSYILSFLFLFFIGIYMFYSYNKKIFSENYNLITFLLFIYLFNHPSLISTDYSLFLPNFFCNNLTKLPNIFGKTFLYNIIFSLFLLLYGILHYFKNEYYIKFKKIVNYLLSLLFIFIQIRNIVFHEYFIFNLNDFILTSYTFFCSILIVNVLSALSSRKKSSIQLFMLIYFLLPIIYILLLKRSNIIGLEFLRCWRYMLTVFNYEEFIAYFVNNLWAFIISTSFYIISLRKEIKNLRFILKLIQIIIISVLICIGLSFIQVNNKFNKNEIIVNDLFNQIRNEQKIVLSNLPIELLNVLNDFEENYLANSKQNNSELNNYPIDINNIRIRSEGIGIKYNSYSSTGDFAFTLFNITENSIIINTIELEVLQTYEYNEPAWPGALMETYKYSITINPYQKNYLITNDSFLYKKGDADFFRINITSSKHSIIYLFRFIIKGHNLNNENSFIIYTPRDILFVPNPYLPIY
jgi:hypothetical protein